MPINNNLKPVTLPMKLRFNEKPTTNFINNLESIKVELLDAPSLDELRNYLPQFITATWQEIGDTYYEGELSVKEKDDIIKQAFFGKALPTALETINLTFRISGISLQEVTHIIRYRTASFSADCSGDKWWTNKDALVPNSIQHSNGSGSDEEYYATGNEIASDDFYARYKQLVEMSKQLYCDMIDSKKISIMDARYILPRCLSTFYYMRVTLKDAIHFIKQRIDKQIQPETDNLIAYYMYIELLKKYKHTIVGLINIHQPSYFYINMARTGKATNLYFPDADSDKFEYNENDFIYQCKREEMNGTDEDAENLFSLKLAEIDSYIKFLEDEFTDENHVPRSYSGAAVIASAASKGDK
jgi:thymidylate synthase (FAD)